MAAPGPALLLGVLLLLSTALTDDVKINKFVGQMILMAPVFDGVPQAFEWKNGTDKIIEVHFPHNPVIYILFTNRFHFNNVTGVLTIKDLQLTDSEEYSAHVLVTGTYQITRFQLRVYPALNKPIVNCTGTNTGVVIRCRHDPDPPTYEWYNAGQPISSSLHNYSLADQNRSLTVGHADWKSLKPLECVVKNPATENRTSVPESCFEKDSHGRSRSGLIAALVMVLLLLVIYGIYGPEDSFLRRFFNFMRKRIQGYQTTATNDQHPEDRKGKGIRSKDEQSDNMNKGVAAKENKSSSEIELAGELPQHQESQRADGGYQTTATNDQHPEDRKGKGIRSKDEQSDNMNKGVAAKENKSSSEIELAGELSQHQESQRADGGFFNFMRKWIQGYQTTATNDQHLEDRKGKGISSIEEQSDNMNKGVAAKENKSSFEIKLAEELPQHQESQRADGGFFNFMRKWIQRYQTTATNDQHPEDRKGKGISSKEEQSDNMNKGVAAKENKSSSEIKLAEELSQHQESQRADGDDGATSASKSTPADLKTHQNERDRSADEGATSAPKSDSNTNLNGRELVKESQNQHDAPPLQSKDSLNSEVP